MHQFSVYSKLLLNNTANKAMIGRLKANNPKKGNITILTVTEKQFARMIYLYGDKAYKYCQLRRKISIFRRKLL